MSTKARPKKFFPMMVTTAGFVVVLHFWRGRVFQATPLLGSLMGRWTVQEVEAYCQKNGWKVVDLPPYWSESPVAIKVTSRADARERVLETATL